jgi:hypothetical protein
MSETAMTLGDEIGDPIARAKKTPTRECIVLEHLRTYDGQVIEWTMMADHTLTPMVVVAVRASHPDVKVAIGDKAVDLRSLPEHGTVRLPTPLFVPSGTRVELDPGSAGSVELLGFELPVKAVDRG